MKEATQKTIRALVIARGNARILHEAASAAPDTRIAAVFDALYKHEYFGEFETEPPKEISRQDWDEMKAEQRTVHKRGRNRPTKDEGESTTPPTPDEAASNIERNTNETRTNGDKEGEGEEEGDRLSLPSVLKGGREGDSGDAPTPPARARSTRFIPPTIEEVREYWATGWEGGGPIPGSPERFFDHFEAVGWRSGRARLKDWRAAARNWGRRQHDFTPTTTPPPPKPEPDPFEYRGPQDPAEIAAAMRAAMRAAGDPSALPSSETTTASPSGSASHPGNRVPGE